MPMRKDELESKETAEDIPVKASLEQPVVGNYQSIVTKLDAEKVPQVIIRDQTIRGRKDVPEFTSQLRGRVVEVPEEIYEVSGIKVFGARIKSILFSTDVAIIRNSNAQSVIAVYPFTPLTTIMQSIINVASVPVFAGVGGGTTSGKRSTNLAFQAEQMGAYGVVVNAPMSNKDIKKIYRNIDIPLIATITSVEDDIEGKLQAGADILNISAGAKTSELVAYIRKNYSQTVPLIATGGPSGKTILQTIEAGANAITYTPPSSADIFATVMKGYRKELENDKINED